MAVNESLFPDLVRTGYQVTSPPDAIYNCIAWAVGHTSAWWWPDLDGFDYWPPGVVREQTLAAFVQAFATVGYVPCLDGSLEPAAPRPSSARARPSTPDCAPRGATRSGRCSCFARR
jgi:hypothetical protein